MAGYLKPTDRRRIVTCGQDISTSRILAEVEGWSDETVEALTDDQISPPRRNCTTLIINTPDR